MSIHIAKYSRYEGELESEKTRFTVIASTEFKRLIIQKWVRRFLLLAFIPMVVFGVYLYVGAVMKAQMGFDVLGHKIYVYFFHSQTWFIAVMMAAFGSDLISKDIAGRGLCLYFTRAVNHTQYMWGKICAMGILVLIVTLGPGLVLSIMQFALAEKPDLLQLITNIYKIAMCSVMLSFMASSVILLLSSLGTRSRLIGISWLALFFLLSLARSIMINAMGESPMLDIISIQRLMYGLPEHIFGMEDSVMSHTVALISLSVFCFYALKVRIQMLEKRMV